MTNPTARVADSYGPDPHEHKPSQDPFLPDVSEKHAEAKQAVSAGAEVDEKTAERAAEAYPEPEGDEPSAGTSSSTSPHDSESSSEKTEETPTPAPKTASRTKSTRTAGSSVDSTATGR